MDLFRTLKCILCLVKCSKYLYYIKKFICFMSIALVGVSVLSALKNNKSILRKLRVK